MAMSSGGAALALVVAQALLLYFLGSYAMSGLNGLLGKSAPSKAVFYLFAAPGVVLHETAHFVACKLLLLRVSRFVPFSPKAAGDGRTTMGYVEHASRDPVSSALVGVAPMLLNPLGAVISVAVLTPLGFGEVLAESQRALDEGIVSVATSTLTAAGGYLFSSPLTALLLFYLLLSFSLGSVLSREDLTAFPAAAVIMIVAVFVFSRLSDTDLLESLEPVSSVAAVVYILPVVVAGASALLVTIALRR